jgi:ATP-dependent DNA ligase
VSKRRDAPYRHGRTRMWLKIKNPASAAAPDDDFDFAGAYRKDRRFSDSPPP